MKATMSSISRSTWGPDKIESPMIWTLGTVVDSKVVKSTVHQVLAARAHGQRAIFAGLA